MILLAAGKGGEAETGGPAPCEGAERPGGPLEPHTGAAAGPSSGQAREQPGEGRYLRGELRSPDLRGAS